MAILFTFVMIFIGKEASFYIHYYSFNIHKYVFSFIGRNDISIARHLTEGEHFDLFCKVS